MYDEEERPEIKEPDSQLLKNRIRDRAKEKGMSLNELEFRSGLGTNTLAGWNGRCRFPRSDNLFRVAEVLDVSMDWLMGR